MDYGALACKFLLNYKLVRFSSVMYSEMGIQTLADLSKNILHDRFPIEDIEHAVGEMVKEGKIRQFYMKNCPECNTKNIFEETDGSTKAGFTQILAKVGQKCQFCQHKIPYSTSDSDIEVVYAVSSDYRDAWELLSDYLGDADEPIDEPYFRRIARWLTPKSAEKKRSA